MKGEEWANYIPWTIALLWAAVILHDTGQCEMVTVLVVMLPFWVLRDTGLGVFGLLKLTCLMSFGDILE